MPFAADIYYQVYRQKESLPVVLLHGAGGNYLSWPSELRRLPGFTVNALDLPGHGKSLSRGRQHISEYAGEVAAWLDQVGLHSAVFIGHSMGSAIALTLALDYPLHVQAVGLVGAGARLRVAPALLDASASINTFGDAVAMTISRSFSSHASARLIELAARRMAETRPAVLHGDFLACNTFDVSNRLGEINAPALVLCGEEDQMTPLRAARFLFERIPDARLEVIPDAGHMVMLERPAEVAEALSRFISTVHYK